MKHVTKVRLGLTRQQRNAAPVVSAVQARTYADAKATPTEVSSILEQRIRGVQEESNLAETGRVLSVGYVFLGYGYDSWQQRGGTAGEHQGRRGITKEAQQAYHDTTTAMTMTTTKTTEATMATTMTMTMTTVPATRCVEAGYSR